MGGDYKALVCILLSGGNDSYNMLIPKGNSEYNQYAAVRSNQAIPQNDILGLSPISSIGKELGIHPALGGLQSLFNDGNLAFMSNVGTLIEPTTKGGIQGQTAKLPLGLLSHSDQVMHWQTAIPQDRTDVGWGGRMADIIKSLNDNNDVSMNISLGGNNIFQRGNEITEYAINNTGGVAIQGWNNPEPFLNMMTQDINSMLNKEYQDIFKDSYRGVLKRSIDSNEIFNAAIEGVEPFNTEFTQNQFSQNLRMIAQSIAARESLGFQRQIFFVQLGGFDNHDELLNNHNNLMTVLDAGLTEFYNALEELNLTDCVTSYTISDFARTLTSNGNGTDHAWGGNTIVMGGAVKGKEIYGEYPDLALGNELDIGGGVLIPSMSADSYFAELALWFGISPNDLSLILPNIGNFYDTGSGQAPIGYLL
jgi:uncharacterized protein (DUF1501 family)